MKVAAWVGGVALTLTLAMLAVLLLLLGADRPPEQEAACATPPATAVTAGDLTGSPIQVTAKAALRYWSPKDAVTAVAVAGAESGYDPTAANPGSTARGLWQIMLSFHLPKFQGADWQDPDANARVAHIIWQGAGGSFSPDWVGYTSGAYLKHLGEAQVAVASVLRGSSTTTTTQQASTTGGHVTGNGPPAGTQPVAVRAAQFIRDKWKFTGVIGGYAPGTGHMEGSKHYSGLALDVMMSSAGSYPSDAMKAMGDSIANYFATPSNAAAFGVDNVIWYNRITNAGRGWQWGDYGHTGVTLGHYDHVHVDFFAGGGTGQPGPVDQAVATVECAQPVVAAGAVVYPVAGGADADSENFGGCGGSWNHCHMGTDFPKPCGTPVVAAHAGTVVLDRSQAWAGPNLVKVTTGPGQLTTWYAHMQSLSVVNGQQVQPGQELGKVGSLGNSTGCHLHFEVHPKGGGYEDDEVDPSKWLAEHVGQAPAAVPASASTGEGEWFRVATFNLLGAGHTDPHGGRGGKTKHGYPSWDKRIPGAVRMVEGYGVSIVGFQEAQAMQLAGFKRLATHPWATWTPERKKSSDSIGWRTDLWQAVGADSITAPYFDGHWMKYPILKLRSLVDGREVVVTNTHNAANVRGNAQKWRNIAMRIQLDRITRLAAGGTPVIFTGDLNERETAFCKLTATEVLHSMAGGSTGTPCRPPAYHGIDWIFGSSAVRFLGFTADTRTRDLRISDHPIVVAAVAR